MYDVSQTWKDLVVDPEHWFETKLSVNGIEYGELGIGIFSLSVDQRVFAEEQPTVGGCLASELSVQMLMPEDYIPRMAQAIPYVRVTDGTNYSEWIPQGVYFIDTRETTHNGDGLDVLTLHCYDSMLKTEADYPNTSHSWPITDIDVVEEIATAIGVDVDPRTYDLISNGYSIGLPAGYSMREVLSNIAAMYAGNWIMSYDGELLFVAVNGIPRETNFLISHAYDYITFGEFEPGGGEETRIYV